MPDLRHRVFGLDEVSRCKTRIVEEYRWTPESYTDEASRLTMFNSPTLSEREMVLAEGSKYLIAGATSLEQVFDDALSSFCAQHGLNYGRG